MGSGVREDMMASRKLDGIEQFAKSLIYIYKDLQLNILTFIISGFEIVDFQDKVLT